MDWLTRLVRRLRRGSTGGISTRLMRSLRLKVRRAKLSLIAWIVNFLFPTKTGQAPLLMASWGKTGF
jgi:hypothetical protein